MNVENLIQLVILLVLIFYLPRAIASSFRVVLADYLDHKDNYLKRDKNILEIEDKHQDDNDPDLWFARMNFQGQVIEVSREAFLGGNFRSDFSAAYSQIAEESRQRKEDNDE